MALRDALQSANTIDEALTLYNSERRAVGLAIANYGRELGLSFSA